MFLPAVPEVTILIHKITKAAGEYFCTSRTFWDFQHWDKRRRNLNGET
jgi:hypothetical protein